MAASAVFRSSEENHDFSELCIHAISFELFSSWFHGKFLCLVFLVTAGLLF